MRDDDGVDPLDSIEEDPSEGTNEDELEIVLAALPEEGDLYPGLSPLLPAVLYADRVTVFVPYADDLYETNEWWDAKSDLGDLVDDESIDMVLEELSEQGVIPDNYADERVQSLFLGEFRRRIASPSSYPMFDDPSGHLIGRAAADPNGILSVGQRSRGKQAAVAEHLIHRLPTFPRATAREILDIRRELHVPLVRFRSGIVELSRQMVTGPWDSEGFESEMQDVYVGTVRPALLDLQESTSKNTYLRELMADAMGDPDTFMKDFIVLGAVSLAHMPELMRAAVVAGGHLVQAAKKRGDRARELKQNRFYFLHEAERRLKRRG